MPTWLLHVLDIAFLILHTALVIFNVIGWVWRRTRRCHLVTMLLTAISWFIMGLRYGVGYCICTDWHWQIRSALGIHDRDNTYIQFLVRMLTGWTPGDGMTRTATGAVFAIAAILTIVLNIRDAREHRAKHAIHVPK